MQSLKKFYFGKSKFKPFVSTWKTDNLSSGSSAATQVRLPLVSTGSYNFVVEWGDGTQSTITAWNQGQVTKTYTVAGTYQITIKGKCIGWVFNNTGDRLKILSVQSWGNFRPAADQAVFSGCANLTLNNVTDILDLTGTSSLMSFFFGCTSLTTIAKINEWKTSGIISTYQMFRGCSNFNQLLSFNTSSVTTMYEMFYGCNLFNQNVSFSTSNVTTMSGMFYGAAAFNNGLASGVVGNMLWNTTNVTTTANMFTSCVNFNQNISTWNTINVTSMNSMFLNAMDFNNGLASGVAGTLSLNTTNVTNMGSMFQNAASFNQNIGGFNVSKVADFGNMFITASKFNNGGSTSINTWVLKTTGTIFMNSMFQSATIFNQPIGNWNVSRVTIMSSMFQSAIAFNQDLSSWDTSSSTTMLAMFNGTTAFNNGLASGVVGNMLWNTTNVTTTANMFTSCVNFNQNLGALNLSNCSSFTSMFLTASKFNNGGSASINTWTLKTTGTITMNSMFSGAVLFNQPIGNWNVSRVTNMTLMFGALGVVATFNQNIGSWNVASVTNMTQMFLNARSFNNGGSSSINSWNTISVSSMSEMFRSTGPTNGFNQPIGSWNVVNVTNMANMFQYQSSFNQDIGLWNVSKVTTMYSMFDQALAFNNGGSSSINNWNTVLCIDMAGMFSNANAFNQPIGSWNVSNVANFTGFMVPKTPVTFSSANLDAIYNGWSSRPVKTPINITFGTAKYTAASSAGRAILTGAPNNWAITDGGI